MKYVLSYGGGVNSTALIFHLLRKRSPLDIVIFADTGEEEPETYENVARMKWECEERCIEFVTVQSHLGTLYNYYMANKALPSIIRRDCTAKFKIRPIRRYLRERFGKEERFVMYIGIAAEEADRMKESDVKYISNEFTLVDDGLDRAACVRICLENRFRAKKSGCKGCPFRPRKEWYSMVTNDPAEFRRWRLLEENCSAFPRMTLLSKTTLKALESAVKNQTTLLSWSEPVPCDVAGGCFL